MRTRKTDKNRQRERDILYTERYREEQTEKIMRRGRGDGTHRGTRTGLALTNYIKHCGEEAETER